MPQAGKLTVSYLSNDMSASESKYDISVDYEKGVGITEETAIPIEFNNEIIGESPFVIDGIWYKISVPKTGKVKVIHNNSKLQYSLYNNKGVAIKSVMYEPDPLVIEVTEGEYFLKIDDTGRTENKYDRLFKIKLEM